MNTRTSVGHWLEGFLWLAVICWGIGLGAKLFEFVVVISAWSANPPSSLALMPYGPKFPFNPGDFFQPLSAVLALVIIGVVVSGRKESSSDKRLLWVPLISLLIIWLATPTLFWPMIRGLYGAGTGLRPLPDLAVHSLVHRWIVLDWLRTFFIAIGFLFSIRAISTIPRTHVA